MSPEEIAQVVAYHQATKHGYHRSARGPGYMDWSNQPDPFRRYSGAPLIYLPIIVRDESPPYRQIFQPQSIAPVSVTAQSISRFFELSLAVSAWKQAGDSRWALRSNPSSGNLHPTEGYLVIDTVAGLHDNPGVYHYAPKEHALEVRTEFSATVYRELMKSFPPQSFLAGLTSIHWREAWKYGERAFRYCQHDIGHALAAYRIAAAALGWKLIFLEEVKDATVSRLFGLDREVDFKDAEQEHPDLVAVVSPGNSVEAMPLHLDVQGIGEIARGSWKGTANRLSAEEIPWEIINSVSEAAWKKEGGAAVPADKAIIPSEEREIDSDASTREARITTRQIVRQRRSAVAFDGVTSISREEFYAMLSQTVSGLCGGVPWDAISWTPKIHLGLFVHRVRGLNPGLYFLLRDPKKLNLFKSGFKKDFVWNQPESCPEGLNLYLLKAGDCQRQAAQVSCTQEIAGQSAFSLGMIAEFLPALEHYGAWFYRRLFWESGMVGQMLYLAAEYAGIRATGIGCYFDDPVHEIFGIQDKTFQSLYHFTVGGPVEDTRLTTLPAYVWSCEAPAGSFVSRLGAVIPKETGNRVEGLPEQATVSWNGIKLARIGAGLSRFSANSLEHKAALSRILNSSINLIQTSPCVTGGEDELLLGDLLNQQMGRGTQKVEGVVFSSRLGALQGLDTRLFNAMEKRGTPFADVVSLAGKQVCLDPEFLRDQLDRSRHRLGVESLDMALLEIPEELVLAIGAEACLQRIEKAARFLQTQCDENKLVGFGISAQGLAYAEKDPHHLSFEKLLGMVESFSGFGAVQFHANFIEREPFIAEKEGRSLVQRAKDRGILVMIGGPLHAKYQGNELLLVDVSEDQKEKVESEMGRLFQALEDQEEQIHSMTLADGRIFRELLRQAKISSPFQFKNLVESAWCFKPEDRKILLEMTRVLDNALYQIRLILEQVVQAKFLQSSETKKIIDNVESLFAGLKQNYKVRLRMRSLNDVTAIREQYFPEAPASISLQTLGILWLLEHGADLVVAGVTHADYVEEVSQILENLD